MMCVPHAEQPANNTPHSIRHYFVDEAGDAVLFNKKGLVIVGTHGCSRYFILGLLDVASGRSSAW